MNLETIKKAAKLYGDLEKIEDKIEFLKQFIPEKPSDRAFSFFRKKEVKPPKLMAHTWGATGMGTVNIDDEMTEYIVQAYEVKRGRILKEIDAL